MPKIALARRAGVLAVGIFLAGAGPALAYGPVVGPGGPQGPQGPQNGPGNPFGAPGSGPTNVGGAGNGIFVTLSTNSVAPGGSFTAGVTSGPCTPGSPVTILLFSTAFLSTNPPTVPPPVPLGTTTANSQGGFPASGPSLSLTIPSDAAAGPYALVALCNGPNGPQAITNGLSIAPNSQAASVKAVLLGTAATADPNWAPPSGWADAAVRGVVQRAVDGLIQSMIRSAEAVSPGAAGPATPAVQGLNGNPAVAHGSAVALRYVAPPVVLLALGALVMMLPRRLVPKIRRRSS